MEIITIPIGYRSAIDEMRIRGTDISSSSSIVFFNKVLCAHHLKHAPHIFYGWNRIWIPRRYYIRLRRELSRKAGVSKPYKQGNRTIKKNSKVHKGCCLLGKIRFKCSNGETYYIYPWKSSNKIKGKYEIIEVN